MHYGGSRAAGLSAHYFLPTLVECASLETKTSKTEMFGPVMSLLAFDTGAEAIALANESDFGLGPGVSTQNIARARQLSGRIRSGIVWVIA